jgi:hypothetical protein
MHPPAMLRSECEEGPTSEVLRQRALWDGFLHELAVWLDSPSGRFERHWVESGRLGRPLGHTAFSASSPS